MLLALLGVAAVVVVFGLVNGRERSSRVPTLVIAILTGAGFTVVLYLATYVLAFYGVGDLGTRHTQRTATLVEVDGAWLSTIKDLNSTPTFVEFSISTGSGEPTRIRADAQNVEIIDATGPDAGQVEIDSWAEDSVFTWPLPMRQGSSYRIHSPSE